MIRFEFKKINNTIYPAYLYLEEYAIALDPQQIEHLKNMSSTHATLSPNELTEQIAGNNRYLKTMLHRAIEGQEQQALLARLKEEIQGL